jgi:Cys-rich protein (TIGR01571 family)
MNSSWKQWKVGYYNCCQPFDLFLKALCCPLCFQAKTIEMVFGDDVWITYCLLCIKGSFGCALNRSRIRDKYHIQGNICGDCWDSATCCCSLMQERKEIMIRGYIGSDKTGHEIRKLNQTGAKVQTAFNSDN